MTTAVGAGGNKWTDKDFLVGVQYRDGSNLSARQAIYAYQQPRVNLWAWALDLAELDGSETVVDVGCGNGRYLATLRTRRHRGLVVGVDLSDGMLAGITADAPTQPLAQADAARLPVAESQVDVVLAMHMLYHLPDPAPAIAEMRRALRSDGRVLVVLNTADHLRELRSLIAEQAVQAGMKLASRLIEGFDVERGADLMSAQFSAIESHFVTTGS